MEGWRPLSGQVCPSKRGLTVGRTRGCHCSPRVSDKRNQLQSKFCVMREKGRELPFGGINPCNTESGKNAVCCGGRSSVLRESTALALDGIFL